MAITVEALKQLAIQAIETQLGADGAKAYSIITFGTAGSSGSADAGRLAQAAAIQPANLTPAAAANVVTDVVKATFVAQLQQKASGAIATGQLKAEAVAQAAAFIAGMVP